MTTLQASKSIHTVSDGYYWKTVDNMIYFFPNKRLNLGPMTNKRLILLKATPAEWSAIKKER